MLVMNIAKGFRVLFCFLPLALSLCSPASVRPPRPGNPLLITFLQQGSLCIENENFQISKIHLYSSARNVGCPRLETAQEKVTVSNNALKRRTRI